MSIYFVISQPQLIFDHPVLIPTGGKTGKIGTLSGPIPKDPDRATSVFTQRSDARYSFTWPKTAPPEQADNLNAWFDAHAICKAGRERFLVTAEMRERCRNAANGDYLVFNGPEIPDLKRLAALLFALDPRPGNVNTEAIHDTYFDPIESQKRVSAGRCNELLAAYFPNLVLLDAWRLRDRDFGCEAGGSIKVPHIEKASSARERLVYASEATEILARYGVTDPAFPGAA